MPNLQAGMLTSHFGQGMDCSLTRIHLSHPLHLGGGAVRQRDHWITWIDVDYWNCSIRIGNRLNNRGGSVLTNLRVRRIKIIKFLIWRVFLIWLTLTTDVLFALLVTTLCIKVGFLSLSWCATLKNNVENFLKNFYYMCFKKILCWIVMDRVPEIGFSVNRNQPKNEFKKQVEQGFSLFFNFWHIWWFIQSNSKI